MSTGEENAKRQNAASRIRSFFFALFIAGIILLLIVYHGVSDRTWWGEWVTIWPPVLWAFPLIALAALTIDIRRKRRVAATLLIVMLFFIHSCQMESGWLWRFKSGSDRCGEFRFVTWNVNGGSGGVEALAQNLRAFDADIILLQESPDPSNVWDDLQPGLLGWDELYFHDAGDCAALSRFPLSAMESEKVGPWDRPQVLKLELSTSRTLLLFNVRLMLPSLLLNPLSSKAREQIKSDHEARLNQFGNLSKLIETRCQEINASDVILAGDFNTPARMWSLNPIRDLGLDDAWLKTGRGWGGTMTANFPVARIDQCWTSGGLAPNRAFVIDSDYSDHLPLIVDFDFSIMDLTILPERN